MSSLSQSSWLCSLHTTKTQKHSSPKSTNFYPLNPKISSFKIIAFALDSSKEESLPEPSSSNGSEKPKTDKIKLAFERAQKYKKSLVVSDSNQSNGLTSKDVAGKGNNENLPGDEDFGKKKNLEVATVDLEKAETYEKNAGVTNNDSGIVEEKDLTGVAKKEIPEGIRIAMEKARKYKKNKGNVDDDVKSIKEGGEADVSEAIRIAMGKASENKKNKGVPGDSSLENPGLTGSMGSREINFRDETIEKNTNKKEGLKVSSMDFVGLNFSDKRSGRGLPAGLVPVVDPYPDGDMQEVEIIVGDSSKFGNSPTSETEKISEDDDSELYKPKVSTWGVFPRPSNISEAFGGGRTLRPGEELESTEDKAAKEARTKQLLAAYKRRMGLNMDPKLKAESEKALNDGDSLMDGGRLKEAVPFYQKVMDNLSFQTELHGLAALQWSICQDSLGRTEEARSMYEKLQSHPNGQVSKKARQFMFSFQAMEIMKVTQSKASPLNADYGSYFEAFVEEKPGYNSGSVDVKDDGLSQALPFILFLASPILLVIIVAVSKGR